MEKSIFTQEYATFLALLRETRRAVGVTQVELAERLQTTQSMVSKMERGEIRLDVVQVRAICVMLGTALGDFIAEWENRLAKLPGRKRGKRKRK